MIDVLQEMHEDTLIQREDVLADLDASRDPEEQSRLRSRLRILDNALDTKSEVLDDGGDDLVDKWERELTEGRDPDLSEVMHAQAD